MAPIVNGLENIFGEQVEFRWQDANSSSGGGAFRYYRLVGHPSYVILNPDGVVLLSAVGELSEALLREEISALIP